MNSRYFYPFYSLLLACIIALHNYMLLYYWGALLLLAIFLNSRTQYNTGNGRLTNFCMFAFTAFIVWERTRHYKFSETPEVLINDAEHILFALLICLIINFDNVVKNGW